jgi:nucleoid DNA-binding protein
MAGAVTKRDLVRRIAAEVNAPTEQVRQIVQQFLDDLVDELAAGRRLEFRDFGVFEVVRRKPRIARNPRTGETIDVPAKSVVHFKQGRVMRERVATIVPASDDGADAAPEPPQSPLP